MLEAMLLFLEHLLSRAGVDLNISLPCRAGVSGCVPEVAAAKTGMARIPQGVLGVPVFPPSPSPSPLPWAQPKTPPAKNLGKEKLPEGQTPKPGDDLMVWAVTADALHENFTPDPPNFSSFPI